jgi:hypothetical protein
MIVFLRMTYNLNDFFTQSPIISVVFEAKMIDGWLRFNIHQLVQGCLA